MFYDPTVLDALPKAERSLFKGWADAAALLPGRPFFVGDDGLPDLELDGFCNYLVNPNRASPRTWATYANQVFIFLRFMEAQEKSWKKATREDLKTYYRVRITGKNQNKPALKGQSWNVAKSALVHLYEYAFEAGYIRELPFKYRRSKAVFFGASELTADLTTKTSPEPINFISIRQYKEFWRPIITKHQNAQRNIALTDLLISSGLRISEALSIKCSQIPDPDDPIFFEKKSIKLRVVGKGKKPRMVLIPKRVIRSLRFYIEEERQEAINMSRGKRNSSIRNENLFLSKTGSSLSARSVEKYFKKISDKTGIRLTPHGCRHTFAIYQLESMIKRMTSNLIEIKKGGADAYRQILNDPLRQLQLLLGHAHITTTYLYLHFLEESEALVDESLADWTTWTNDNV